MMEDEAETVLPGRGYRVGPDQVRDTVDEHLTAPVGAGDGDHDRGRQDVARGAGHVYSIEAVRRFARRLSRVGRDSEGLSPE